MSLCPPSTLRPRLSWPRAWLGSVRVEVAPQKGQDAPKSSFRSRWSIGIRCCGGRTNCCCCSRQCPSGLEVFPQPFLSLLVLGIALLAAGLTLHFLRSRLTPPPRSAAAPPLTLSQPSDEAHLVGRVIDGNPYSQAAALHREHEGIKTRKALRRIREELRDDRRRVQRASDGDLREIRQIRFQAWREEEETLLEMTDPEPHSASRQAYRELEGIEDVIYIRESISTLRLRNEPRELLETDIQTTFEAIDQAVRVLSDAEGGT